MKWRTLLEEEGLQQPRCCNLGALISQAPRAKDAILAEEALRRLALLVYRPRAGESPAQSTDKTIIERLNKMRITGRLAYDPGTSRWIAGAAV